jgi:hypothetical protein
MEQFGSIRLRLWQMSNFLDVRCHYRATKCAQLLLPDIAKGLAPALPAGSGLWPRLQASASAEVR